MKAKIFLFLAAIIQTVAHADSRIIIESQSGDVVGAGANYDLQGELTVLTGQDYVDIYDDDGWNFKFRSASGLDLEPGAYYNASYWTTYNPEDAGIAVGGPRGYCGDRSGEFFVYELLADYTNPVVAIDFVQYCDSSTAALTGSIRINSDIPHKRAGPLAAAVVTPARLTEGESVQLDARKSFTQNGSIISYQWEKLTGPSVRIADENSLNTIVEVTETIPLGGSNLTMQLRVTDDSSLSNVYSFDLPVSSKSDPKSFLSFSSEEGDYIAQGRSWYYDDSDSRFSMSSYNVNQVSVSVDNYDYWSVDFGGPSESKLQAGFYDNATRFPFQDAGVPGVSISGDGRGCNQNFGNFTIKKIVWQGDEPTELRATFEQRCESRTGSLLTGEVAVNSYHESVPTASAGTDFSVEEGGVGNLNGSGSYDAIGTDIRYQWSTDTASVSVNSADQSRANFTAPALGDREYSRDVHFKLSIVDDEGYQAQDSVRVTITSNNEPPFAEEDFVTVVKGGSVSIYPLQNDIDVDGRLLVDSIVLYEPPSYGNVVINSDGSLQYTHTADSHFPDELIYGVEDNDGDISLGALITITVTDEAVIIIDDSEVGDNDPPLEDGSELPPVDDESDAPQIDGGLSEVTSGSGGGALDSTTLALLGLLSILGLRSRHHSFITSS